MARHFGGAVAEIPSSVDAEGFAVLGVGDEVFCGFDVGDGVDAGPELVAAHGSEVHALEFVAYPPAYGLVDAEDVGGGNEVVVVVEECGLIAGGVLHCDFGTVALEEDEAVVAHVEESDFAGVRVDELIAVEVCSGVVECAVVVEFVD